MHIVGSVVHLTPFRLKKLLTGARLKFPILEQGSNIQRAFSVRLAILKRVLDSGLSGLMDVLSCRILGKLSLVKLHKQ
jgi:hypothetical protein